MELRADHVVHADESDVAHKAQHKDANLPILAHPHPILEPDGPRIPLPVLPPG